jgi:dihydroflavonol-4-reductase
LSKHHAEQEVAKGIAAGLDGVIANPCSILGYGDIKFFPVIQTALRKIPVCLSGGSHLVDVRDLAEAMILLIEKGKTGDRYLLTGDYHTQREIMTVLCRLLKTRPPAFAIPGRVLVLAIPILAVTDRLSGRRPNLTRTVAENGIYPSFYSNLKSRNVLGWQPRHRLDESFREVVRYYYEMHP